MNAQQLEAFIHFHEGTATVTPDLLSAADMDLLYKANKAGAFVQAQTNMGQGYTVVGIVAVPSSPSLETQEAQAFVLIYSGEAEVPLPEA
ncbi:hypothetical protein [Deinococcus sp. Leaf326]|uniref:hypothetical protein n=1 Tax=Deinococcus sp. Leaf326 TaxID=1736338 RepID=UPI0006F8F954|nr:hypothetical protein [Deinococcus sp. Leaf326]KQQ98843.1 hypothetical protein ASF71_21970 [Deinococcus sp. Leaf326]